MGLSLGKNVNISSEVKFYTLQHDYNSFDFKGIGGSVTVDDYAWVSVRATILPGCLLGKGL